MSLVVVTAKRFSTFLTEAAILGGDRVNEDSNEVSQDGGREEFLIVHCWMQGVHW